MNVLLLYPNTGMVMGSTVAPPHGLLTVAAPVLASGYSVRLLDQRVEPVDKEVIKKYLSSDTICVAISAMTGTQINYALKEVRKRGKGIA